MSKSTKITVLFVMIFLVGVLGFVTYINRSLNNSHSPAPAGTSQEITPVYIPNK